MTHESQLIGKQAILQLDEYGCVPDAVWEFVNDRTYYFHSNFLERCNLLKKGVTIKNINAVHYFNHNNELLIEECFSFNETGKDMYGRDIYFLARYFQIAIKNHPLTAIFGD